MTKKITIRAGKGKATFSKLALMLAGK